MRYIIEGDYPVLRCTLDKGEMITASAGAMSWITDGFELKTNTGGGVMKGLARAFAGEGMFLNHYTAVKDNQEIAFASSLPGSIIAKELNGETLIGQKTAYLASTRGVKIDIVFTKKFTSGLFGGEGFILQRFSGNGMLFLEADGSLVEYELKDRESMLVDQGHLFLFESSVKYEITTMKGMKNILFGGEGLFLVKLTGPGKIILQSMPVSNLAKQIIPYVPSKG